EYGINKKDFLIVTGGKIDNTKKQIMLLIKAVKHIKNRNVKLILFGSIAQELREKVQDLLDDSMVHYIGWIESQDCYKYFAASDLAVFPGRHSVLWEQAVGTGVPCLFRYWDGTTHVDVGGNSLFLYNDTVNEIES